MAYKRKSPMPIIEGGTNAQTFATADGTSYFDGTRVVVTATGTAGQVLTSNGAGVAPTYQDSPLGGVSFLSTSAIVVDVTTATYITPFGVAPDTVQNNAQFIMPISGTISNLYINVFLNSSSSDVVVTLNKNSSATAVTLTVPLSTTGLFSDTTHSASYSVGDLIQIQIGAGSSGASIGYTCISMKFVSA